MNCLNEGFVEKMNGLLTAKKEAIKEAKPKIQRVPAVLRVQNDKALDLNLEKFYEPRWISIGPIHHGKPKFELAEKYKFELAAKFIGDGGYKSWREFYDKISDAEMKKIIEECFSEEINRDYKNRGEDIKNILVFDGCAVLQFIDSCCKERGFGELKDLKIKNDLIAFTQHDLFLLENQIPYLVLLLLIKARSKDSEKLKDSIKKFISKNVMAPEKYQKDVKVNMDDPKHAHLLDLLLSALIRKPRFKRSKQIKSRITKMVSDPGSVDKPEKKQTETDSSDLEQQDPSTKNKGNSWAWARSSDTIEPHKEQQSFRSVMDLKSAGINFKPSEKASLRHVHFSSFGFGGTLKLPPLVVDDSTGSKFMNLIAYEMCPDNTETKYEVTSYIGFLDSLIDYPSDVKELRSARILHNLLGCDEDVAQLFNKIATDLVPNTNMYGNVVDKIERHYKKRYMTWMAQVFNDHFSTPWTIVAFLAAAFAIGMSAVQTWFAVFSENPCDELCKGVKKL